MITVTILYAGLLGLMSLVLSAASGIMRGKKNIDAGDGGDRDQLFAMRRHANFVEYVPLALILIGLLEFKGVASNFIHYLGAALLVGRVLHAAFFTQGVKSVPRGIGAGITAIVIAVSSIWLLSIYF
jgi:uncharacterized protein